MTTEESLFAPSWEEMVADCERLNARRRERRRRAAQPVAPTPPPLIPIRSGLHLVWINPRPMLRGG
jgi:hypothetical protein